MKKKLLSLALVLVLAAAIALPVFARDGGVYPLGGATVTTYSSQVTSTYAQASTSLSADGMVYTTMYCYGAYNGQPYGISTAGPMDPRNSHASMNIPAGMSIYVLDSEHNAEYNSANFRMMIYLVE